MKKIETENQAAQEAKHMESTLTGIKTFKAERRVTGMRTTVARVVKSKFMS